MTNKIIKIQNICKRIINSNLLVFDSEITFFLQDITSNSDFLEIIKNCNQNYSFEEDWERFQKLGQITIHSNKKYLIAFVVGLFYKIDIKEISSIDMLLKFYGKNNDTQGALNEFGKKVILPFQEAFIYLLNGNDINFEKKEDKPQILDKMNEDILEKTKALYQKISSAKKLSQQEIFEMLAMIKGFEYVLVNNDIYVIKLVWVGMKNTLSKYNLRSREISEIEKLFSLYGLDMEINI